MEEQEEIGQLRAWYTGRELPDAPIVLNDYTKITNTAGFVEASFRSIDTGKPARKLMAIRELRLLKLYIESV